MVPRSFIIPLRILTTFTVIILSVAAAHALQIRSHGSDSMPVAPDARPLMTDDGDLEGDKLLSLMESAYSSTASSNLKRENPGEPIKCLTPFIKLYRNNRANIRPELRERIESLLARPSAADADYDTLVSSSGKFRFIYTTSGSDSVSAVDSDENGFPDYVEWAAAYMDSAWNYEVAKLGFADPVTDQNRPYSVYFENNNFYGSTNIDQDGETYIQVHSTFDGFPDNTDPEGRVKGSLKVTLAHELKHAINYIINQWSGEPDAWAEMDATLMEEVVYDTVNDYYNYLEHYKSIFSSPTRSLYPGSYQHITWALYFAEHFRERFWVNVWDQIKESGNSYITMVQAIDSVLHQNQTDFEHHFTRNHLWHFATGEERIAPDFGFQERRALYHDSYAYPASNLTYKHDSLGVPDSISRKRTVYNLAAEYISIKPTSRDRGKVQVELHYDSTSVGLGLLGYTGEGVRQFITTSRGKDSVLALPEWRWSELHRLGVVVTNPSQHQKTIEYQIRFGTFENPIVEADIPDHPRLQSNYPNPFNSRTNIRFTLPEPATVTLTLYDITGRRIQTLIRNEEKPAGRFIIPFNASNLASGIYIYRLRAGDTFQARKMTVIK